MSRPLIVVATIAAGVLSGSVYAKPHVYDWQKRQRNAPSAEQRRQMIQPVQAGELRIEPMFRSVGVTWGGLEGKDGEVVFVVRKVEGVESCGLRVGRGKAYYFKEQQNWRGMVWGLEEDTEYEVKVIRKKEKGKSEDIGEELKTGRFRTWASEVPIAKTVTLDRNTKFPLVVSDRGTAQGWIRYTASEPLEWDPGTKIATGSMFQVTNAAFVVFDDMKIRAKGALNGFLLQQSEDVRIRNCDLSKWGKRNNCILEDAGHYGLRWDEKKKKAIGSTWSQGIYLDRGMKRTVIERCYLHDPQARSTTWRHSHPSNVQGITLGCVDNSTVIRYCDILGSDAHRWDDAITGKGNFSPDGGFNRTAEIYGNFLHLPNDDSIELDGGQQNIACYRNRFEGGLVGISIQGCVASPSFVFENLVSGLGEERGEIGYSVKTSGFDIYGVSPRSWVCGNVMWGRGNTGIDVFVTKVPGSCPQVDCFDNILCGRQKLLGAEKVSPDSVKGNRVGVELKAEELDPRLPERPLGFVLSVARLEVGDDHSERKIKVEKVGGESRWREEEFEVVKNEVFDWFEVEPARGVIREGMEFTVRFNEERMQASPVFRGSFLVRTKNGLSRPVSVYATSGWTQPERCERAGEFAEYRHPSDAQRDAEGFDVYTFTAPKDGRYYFLQFAKADRRVMALGGVDDEEPERYMVQTCWKYPVWSIIHPGRPRFSSRPGRISYYDFKAGTVHKLRVKQLGVNCETVAFAMTDAPLSFEPQIEYVERYTGPVELNGFEGEEASFSPDGTKLLFRRAVGGTMQIRTVELESGCEQIIYDGPGGGAFPSWAPDGSILYCAYPSTNTAFEMKSSTLGWNVYRSSRVTERLTSGREHQKCPHQAPDGTLYYQSDAIRPKNKKVALAICSAGLMAVKDGRAETYLQPETSNSYFAGFKVNPNGEDFVMAEVPCYRSGWRLAAGKVSAPERRQFLTEATMLAYAPCWSPDGKLIAFTGCRADDDGWYVYVMAPQPGKPLTRIGRGKNPAFSPDGRRIVCDLDGRLRVYELGKAVEQ